MTKKLYRDFRDMPKESIFAILLSSVVIGIIVWLFTYNKDLSGLIGSVVGIAIGLLVTILFYKVQKRDQERIDKMI